MTWTAVGSINPNTAPGSSNTFSFTPSAVGNLVFVGVQQFANGTVFASALSSTNVTWTPVTHSLGTSNLYTETIFIGKVTVASAATVTVTWSGTSPGSSKMFTGREFHSSAGSWAVDVSGTVNSPSTATWASLTPTANGELYVGHCLNSGSAVAGSTTGFTYAIDANGDGLAYNLNCSAGTAYAPVWGDSGQVVGAMALIKESAPGTTITPAVVHGAATVPAPVVRLPDASVRPVVVSASASIPAPAIHAGSYRLFPATNGPSTAVTTYSGPFISGVVFAVTGGGNWFDGYWWWVANTGQETTPVKCALWSVDDLNTTSGRVVPGSVVTSGTLTAGAWNYIPLPGPVQLSPSYDPNSSANGSAYIAAIGFNGHFSDTINDFSSTGSYPNGIVNGPLVAYSSDGSGTGRHWNLQQGVFTTAGADPSTTMPALRSNNGDNFWVDVQISDTPPDGYNGTYRLWPNKAAGNNGTELDDATAYNVATQINIASPVVAKYIHYYVLGGTSTAAGLATAADIWDINTGTSVASIPSPAWTTEDGGAVTLGSSGQWVKAAFAGGGVTLPAGRYRVSVYNAHGGLGGWNPKDPHTGYFTVGVASNGISWGPLTAPNLANADVGTFYPGTGTGTTNAQPVFAWNGSDSFPNITTGNNPPQVYWVDLEVAAGASASVPVGVIAAVASLPAPQKSTGAKPTPAAVAAQAQIPSVVVKFSTLSTPVRVSATTSIPVPGIKADSIVSATAVAAGASVPVPAVSAGSSTTATPGGVAASAAIPSPGITWGTTRTPSAVGAVASVPVPSVSAGGGSTTHPVTVAATSAIPAPVVTAVSTVLVLPGAVGAASSLPAPVITWGTTRTPGAVSATSVIPAPVVAVSGSATAAPGAVSCTASLPAPAVTAVSGGMATPAAITPASSIPAPAVSASAKATPLVIGAAVQIPNENVTTSGTSAPAGVTASASLPVPGIQANSLVSASVIAALTSLPAPAVSAGGSATALPGAVSAAASLPVPSRSAGATAAPAAVSATAVLTAPQVQLGAITSATAVSAAASIPGPSVTAVAGATVHPAALVATASLPAAHASVSMTAHPSAINAVSAIPASQVRVSTTVNAAVVVAAVRLGLSSIIASDYGSSDVTSGPLEYGTVMRVHAPMSTVGEGQPPSSEVSSGIAPESF